MSWLFSDPFYEGGTTVSSEVPARFPVAIAGHPYTIDLTQYERASLDVVRQQADQSDEPSEQSFNPYGLWRRSVETWHHGAGQINFDLGDQSDRARFRSSKGVDVWTQGQLSLLPDVDEKLSTSASNLKMCVAGSRLYVLDGQNVKFTTDISVGAPSWTTVTGTPAETPTSITSNGFTVWIAYPSGPYSTNTGTSAASALGTQDVDLVLYGNGRLLASHDNVLYELSAAGAATTLYTHPNTSFVWDALAVAPQCFYAAGHAGANGEVYAVGLEETSTALSSVVSCTALPDGEYVTALFSYVGVVFMGTNKGVRLASVDGGRNLNYGVLIPTGAAVQCFEGEGEYVWFGWTNYDSTSTGLGRLAPGTFTDTLRPAYASDLMVTGAGAVTDCVTFGGLRCFAVAADGYYAEDTARVASGAVESGLIRWGSTERKTIHSVDLRTQPLPAGGEVSVEVAFDDGVFDGISELTLAGATGPNEPYFARNSETEQAELRLSLTRATDTSTGPTVLRSTLRALVSPTRAEQIVVPIILKEVVNIGAHEDREWRLDTAAEFRFLKGLESLGSIVTYQEGVESWTVTVEKVALRPESWTDRKRWLNGTCFVTLRTIA